MPLSASQVKSLVRERGWTFVDLAARWGISVTWMSRLVNLPHDRPAMYEDAFNGLPLRAGTSVDRQPRHIRKRKASTAWTIDQMFPPRRLFEALDSKVVDEGTLLYVHGIDGRGRVAVVRFRLAEFPDDVASEISLDVDTAQVHLADLCRDLPAQ